MTNPTDQDVAALVARLKNRALAVRGIGKPSGVKRYDADLDEQAATALSTLAAERERAIAREEKCERIISDLCDERGKLKRAIFGGNNYAPTLKIGNFMEMARDTERGRLGAIARAEAAEARATRLQAERDGDVAKAVAAEREACARICDTHAPNDVHPEDHSGEYRDGFGYGVDIASQFFATIIRTRPALTGDRDG